MGSAAQLVGAEPGDARLNSRSGARNTAGGVEPHAFASFISIPEFVFWVVLFEPRQPQDEAPSTPHASPAACMAQLSSRDDISEPHPIRQALAARMSMHRCFISALDQLLEGSIDGRSRLQTLVEVDRGSSAFGNAFGSELKFLSTCQWLERTGTKKELTLYTSL